MTPVIRKHLKESYTPFWGNIELYAPRVRGSRVLDLAFTGPYRVAIEGKNGTCAVDGHDTTDDEIITLSRGEHTVTCARSARFILQAPEVKHMLNPRYKKRRELFPRAYDR
jgi:hypothetical protein